MTTRCTCLALAAMSTAYLWLPAAALPTQVGTLIDVDDKRPDKVKEPSKADKAPDEADPIVVTGGHSQSVATVNGLPVPALSADEQPDPVIVVDQAAAQERSLLDKRVEVLEKRIADAEAQAEKARTKEKDALARVEAARNKRKKEDDRVSTEETKAAAARDVATQHSITANNELTHVLQQSRDASAAHRDAEMLAREQMEKKFKEAQASADAINKDARESSFEAGAYAQRQVDQVKLTELTTALEENANAAAEGYAIQSKLNEMALKAGQDTGEAAIQYDPRSPAGLRIAEALSEASYSTGELNKLQDEADLNKTSA